MTQQKPHVVLPPLGRSEDYYAHLAHEADKTGDVLAHETAKVAQYLTLALDKSRGWEEKQKYFKHVLKRHCQPPMAADDETVAFHKQMAMLVMRYAGLEALRIMSREDDLYAARLSMGQDRQQIEDEAEAFFEKIMGHGDQRPDWFTEEDWEQMKLIHDQWI